MSRPCSSVPGGWPGAPRGASRSRMLPVVGSYGARSGANTADSTMAASSTPANSVTRSCTSRCPTRRQYDGVTTAMASRASSTEIDEVTAGSAPDDLEVGKKECENGRSDVHPTAQDAQSVS